MIRNRNIDRYWSSLFIPAVDFSSARGVSATPAIASPTTTNDLANINSTGIFGVAMSDANDVIRHLLALPRDVDYGHPIHARVYWTSGSTTTTDTVTWAITRQAISPNSAALTATVGVVLDTAIAQDTVPVATAYALCRTSAGKIEPRDTIVVSGNNGVTTSASATTHTFTSAGATFSAANVHIGDIVRLNGTDYVVVSASTTTLVFAKTDGSSFDPGAATGVVYSVRRSGVRPNEMHEIQLKLTERAAGVSATLHALGLELLYVPLLSPQVGTGNTPALPSDWQ